MYVGLAQRVQLKCQHGIRADKPYMVCLWDLIPFRHSNWILSVVMCALLTAGFGGLRETEALSRGQKAALKKQGSHILVTRPNRRQIPKTMIFSILMIRGVFWGPIKSNTCVATFSALRWNKGIPESPETCL